MIIEQSLDDIETISLRKLRSSPSIKPGMRKRSARTATSAFMGGIATNIITTFWGKRGSGSGTKIRRLCNAVA